MSKPNTPPDPPLPSPDQDEAFAVEEQTFVMDAQMKDKFLQRSAESDPSALWVDETSVIDGRVLNDLRRDSAEQSPQWNDQTSIIDGQVLDGLRRDSSETDAAPAGPMKTFLMDSLQPASPASPSPSPPPLSGPIPPSWIDPAAKPPSGDKTFIMENLSARPDTAQPGDPQPGAMPATQPPMMPQPRTPPPAAPVQATGATNLSDDAAVTPAVKPGQTVPALSMHDRAADDATSSTLGGYRVKQLLGEGAMGKVYLAEHEMLGRPAAIKVLHAAEADQEAVDRFFKEARAASAINHPGIVQVYDVGESDQGSFLVMELLEGETLEDRLLREQMLDIKVAARFAVQIASALSAAHDNGIVHRDLKPANIFITPDAEVGGGERIKILDFGIAKVAASDASHNTSQTRSDMLMGSPTYMSPEQCRGAQNVDQRADLYSLGCILFEMLCGRPPFEQQVVAAVIAAHLREQPPAPTSLRPDISQELEVVVFKLLAKDAEQRYQNAEELIDGLVQGVGHSLVNKTGVSRTMLLSRVFTTMVVNPKRRPFALIAAALLIAGAVALVLMLRARDQPDEELAVSPDSPTTGETREPPAVIRPTGPARPVMRVRMLATNGSEAFKTVDYNGREIDTKLTVDQRFDNIVKGQNLFASALSGELQMEVGTYTQLLQIEQDQVATSSWNVSSEPTGARVVYSDGTPIYEGSVTPMSVEFPSVERTETLYIELDGYEREEVPVSFDSDIDKKLSLVLIPEVTIDAEPAGAAIFKTSGQKLGDLPWTTKVSRRSDRRKLIIKLADYEDREVIIGPGQEPPADIKLEALTRVTIETRPKGVEVVNAGGEVQGVTPWAAKLSKQGKPITLTLRHPEYEEMALVLDPTDGFKAVDRTIALERKIQLKVRTRPDKATILDEAGNPFETTPWTTLISRKDAPRTLTISHEDYEDYPLIVGPEAELPSTIKLTKIPVLKVESKPAKAEIIGVDGQSLGVTPQKFPLSSKQGTMQLTLRSPGYEDLAITLRHDEKPPRRYELDKLPSIKLATKTKKVTVFDQQGTNLGETPVQLAFDKDKRPLQLILRKDGFEDYPLQLAYGEKPPADIVLTPLESAVSIRSNPKGAEVFDSSGTKLGETPMSVSLGSNDKSMDLVLKKSGYREAQVTVTKDDGPKKDVALARLAVITLESKPPGATVYDAAGTKIGVTPYSAQVERSSTELTYRIEQTGYDPQVVRVTPTRDVKKRISLERETVAITIEFVTTPAGASVSVDGKRIGKTPFTFTRKGTSGKSTYTIRLDGHQRQRLRLADDESTRQEIELEKCSQQDNSTVVIGALANPYQCND